MKKKPDPAAGRLSAKRRNAPALQLSLLLFLLVTAGMALSAGCGRERTIDLHGYQRSEIATNYVAIVTDQHDEAVIIQLLPEYAPKTVTNFQKLVGEKFYDNLTFHRVVQGFVIQGGDPEGTGGGGPGYTISGEFANNGFANDLKHTRGAVSMARTDKPDTAGSQFFICLDQLPDLDGDYATFGQVLEGMDTVDQIAAVANSGSPYNRPDVKQVMQEVFFVTPPAA